MKLSIITINFNNEVGLKKTIESVVSQSMRDFEWIVIDGGSTDGSKKIIEQNKQYIAYWCSEPDRGIYHAMNKGIRASHGDYLMFLNSGDSLYDNQVIERVVPLLNVKDIYVGRINSVGRENANNEEQADFSPEGILRKLTFTWIPHQASFFKKTFFETYGLYREDQKIVSDWWAYYKSLILGNATIEALPLIISNYDIEGISATQRSQAMQEQENLLKEHPLIEVYYHFYQDNLDIVTAIQRNRIVFMLFRIYFYFYRRFTKKR